MGREIQGLICWRPHTVERPNEVEPIKSAICDLERDGIPHRERPRAKLLGEVAARGHSKRMRVLPVARPDCAAIS